MKTLKVAALTLAVLGCTAGTAAASSITYLLNCTITNTPANACTAGGPFGTVTLSDTASPNDIDVTVALYNLTQTVNFLSLNWNGAGTPATGSWSAVATSGTTGTIAVVAGYNTTAPILQFDLRFNPSAPNNPLTFRLSNSTVVNLDPSMFDTTDNVLHTVYLDVNTGPGTAELRYGSTAHDASSGVFSAAVPEPASLVLFGTGLVGLAALRRRKARR